MSNGRDFSKIVEAARIHYENLKTDITNAQNRVEHIRLSALAQEAHNLLTDLNIFYSGLVYSHVQSTDLSSAPKADVSSKEEPLDLPEFRSPYKPQD
jgi:hypothetical protein